VPTRRNRDEWGIRFRDVTCSQKCKDVGASPLLEEYSQRRKDVSEL